MEKEGIEMGDKILTSTSERISLVDFFLLKRLTSTQRIDQIAQSIIDTISTENITSKDF